MTRTLVVCVAVLLWGTAAIAGQDPQKQNADKTGPQLKVQIVLTEQDGSKEIAKLPYVLYVPSDEGGRPLGGTSLRVGARVPVALERKEGGSSTQYMDIGTNIDCGAAHLEGSRFKLRISTERSSVYAPGAESKAEPVPGSFVPGTPPIVRQFRGLMELLITDGQTVSALVAADPGSGHLLSETVTITVIK